MAHRSLPRASWRPTRSMTWRRAGDPASAKKATKAKVEAAKADTVQGAVRKLSSAKAKPRTAL